MEAKAVKSGAVILGLLTLTSLLLAFTVDVRLEDEPGVWVRLPDRVGEWVGADVRFCQNPACLREYRASDLSDPTRCPACGSELASMHRAERDLLPKDTEVVKKDYRSPSGRAIYASVVLSGRERTSIHRPEVCLVGQGYRILGDRIVDVPLDGRRPLSVKVLDLLRPVRLPNGETTLVPYYYAYWFVGKTRETPYHWERMLWMATDRILHNVAHRWAYISISGMRDENGSAHIEEIREFVRLFYPQIVREKSLVAKSS